VQVHIGRQPIYDRTGGVVAYELLFRGGADAVHATRTGAYATSQVIVNAFTEFGVSELVGVHDCFINVTRDFLVGDLELPFEPDRVVLEVLETVAVDDEVVTGVAGLVDRGYAVALDDFVWGLGHEKLLGLASYVKLDVLGADPGVLGETVARCRRYPGIRLLAEKLETGADLALARRLGFELFQGYALSRPQVLTAATLSPSRVRRVQLLAALAVEDCDLDDVVSIVAGDPALSFRVLRATNSAAAGLPRQVSSVRDAVVLLGTVRIRQWVSLMLVSDIAEATEEQLAATMATARLCQTLADRLGAHTDAAFTAGLLAGVADLLGAPVTELVAGLPLTDEVTGALVDGAGPLGEVLALVRAYQADEVTELLAELPGVPVDPAELAHAYLDALGWSTRTVAAVSAG
jgi:c-di-GMP-related signal transduction protein